MTLALPERGQPIDVTYLYRMAQAINDITAKVVVSTYNNTTVGQQSVQTSNAMIHCTETNLAQTVSKDTSIEWHVDLTTQFLLNPSVTCSVFNRGKTAPGNDAIVTITNITPNRVDGVIKFLTAGSVNVDVIVQAIGIPV